MACSTRLQYMRGTPSPTSSATWHVIHTAPVQSFHGGCNIASEQLRLTMNKVTTYAIACIFIPSAILAMALDRHATTTLIPRWCAANPVCAASRTATSADPLRF